MLAIKSDTFLKTQEISGGGGGGGKTIKMWRWWYIVSLYLRSSVEKKVECRADVMWGSMKGRCIKVDVVSMCDWCRVDVGSMWSWIENIYNKMRSYK